MDMFCGSDRECSAKQHGVVTVRGGDHVDWYAVKIPASGNACNETLHLELQWTVPRDESQLGLSVWSPYHKRASSKVGRRRERVAGAHARIVIDEPIDEGTFFIGVHALGEIGAGAYTLRVVDRWDTCGWSTPIADLYRPRPEGIATPASSVRLVTVSAAGMARQQRDGMAPNVPSLVLDASNTGLAVGSRAVLVDERGARIRHGEIEVVEIWSPEGTTRLASAKFLEPGWFRRKIETGWSYWFAAPQ